MKAAMRMESSHPPDAPAAPGPTHVAPRPELRLATAPLQRPPSQKELANVLGVTTRHLRRWEQAERATGHPCSRPYTPADLWRIYQRRRPKSWDRAEAARLRLAPLFAQFDEILGRDAPPGKSNDPPATLTALMLESLALDDANPAGSFALPQPMRANLARAAKEQLREIFGCAPARNVLIRAYFEAALLADTGRPACRDESSLAA